MALFALLSLLAVTVVVALLLPLPAFTAWPGLGSRPSDDVDSAFGYSAGRACSREPTPSPTSLHPSFEPCALHADRTERAAVARSVKVAVIIISHDEAGCALRRTLLSVASRTPTALLAESVVMDDASAVAAETSVARAGGLGGAASRVRWLRSDDRLGVVRARMMAARAVSVEASVLAFLDAHSEPQPGWMPPLLDALSGAPRAVALPVLEGLDRRTWAHKPPQQHLEHPPRGTSHAHSRTRAHQNLGPEHEPYSLS